MLLFFQVFLNGIVFLILAAMYALLVNKNTIDFCMFISYPVTLLNSFILNMV